MDVLQVLNVDIVQFFFDVDCSKLSIQKIQSLIRKHSANLAEGDFSFTLDPLIWQKHLELPESDILETTSILSLKSTGNSDSKTVLQNLVTQSKNWSISLNDAREERGRCHLFLDRLLTTKFILKAILTSDNYGYDDKIEDGGLYFEEPENRSDDLSTYRTQLVAAVVMNLANYSKYKVLSDPTQASIRVEVRSTTGGKQRPKQEDRRSDSKTTVVCGPVIDAENNKVTKTTLNEYVSLRSTDMQLMAMHKYGVRVQNEEHFRDLIDQLGKAAVIVDLLEAKHTSPVSVKRNGQGSSKGASFILYNSARIETLLRTFDERVRIGYYPKLADFNDVDIGLLKEEEEWKLVFNYILAFPNLLKRSLDGLESGRCTLHILPQFLSGLVGVFSIYYRRIRILTDNRQHLIPTVHVRIYLIMCIREILNQVLGILNIKPVNHM